MFTPTRGNDPIWLIFFIFQRGWIQPTRLIFPKFFLMAWCCHLYYSMRKNIHGFGFRCCKIPWDFWRKNLQRRQIYANLAKAQSIRCRSKSFGLSVESACLPSLGGSKDLDVERAQRSWSKDTLICHSSSFWFSGDVDFVQKRHQLVLRHHFFQPLVLFPCS